MSEMSNQQAMDIIKAERECVLRQGRTGECCRDEMGCGACDLVMEDVDIIEAYDMAIDALADNKPSRSWIAKNEYRRGWHDAITRALSEGLKIHVGNETFDMVQKETLIGLGLSMDSALGAEPYSETEESYPEPDRPHGEWKDLSDGWQEGTYECSNCKTEFVLIEGTPEDNEYNFCPNCGSPMTEKALEILRKREGDEK